MSNILKIALIQHKAEFNDINANLLKGLNLVKDAKELDADIVLFPEMWSNGYSIPFEGALDNPFDEEFIEQRKQWLDQSIDLDSHFVKSFCDIAKEQRIGIVLTYLGKTNSYPQNKAILINRDGDIILDYAKVHTCDFSVEALLESGNEFKVAEFDDVKIGLMICYDREFPESARILMLKGTEIILVPNACDINPARLNQLSTRAFENMVGIAMANYPNKSWGQSCAFSPIVFNNDGNYVDNTIVINNDIDEGIIIVDFNLDHIRQYRNNETWGNAFRKVKAYDLLINDEVKEPFIRKKLR